MDTYFARKKIEEIRTSERNKIPFPEYVLNEDHTLLIHRDALFRKLDEEEQAREEARLEAERKARAAVSADKKIRPRSLGVETEDASSDQAWPKKRPGAFSHKLFDRKDVIKQFQRLAEIKDGDAGANTKGYLKALKKSGEYRTLSSVTPDYREQLQLLAEECPNFGGPIAYVRRVMTLALREKKPPVFAKILLNGPPGVGKTYFAQRLAKVINTTLHIVHLESMQMSNDLLGNSRNWSNSTPGAIFNLLLESEHGDPILLLDEIDKVKADERYDVNGALLGLLEEGTAATYRDQCETWLKLDASKIIYLATSNNVDAIQPAVRSRLRKFDIAMPSDSTAVIKSIFRQIQTEFPTATQGMHLDEGAVGRLLKLAPRKIREALRDAVGLAVDAGRLSIVADDIEDSPAIFRIGF